MRRKENQFRLSDAVTNRCLGSCSSLDFIPGMVALQVIYHYVTPTTLYSETFPEPLRNGGGYMNFMHASYIKL
jgi:hypothetical protein